MPQKASNPDFGSHQLGYRFMSVWANPTELDRAWGRRKFCGYHSDARSTQQLRYAIGDIGNVVRGTSRSRARLGTFAYYDERPDSVNGHYHKRAVSRILSNRETAHLVGRKRSSGTSALNVGTCCLLFAYQCEFTAGNMVGRRFTRGHPTTVILNEIQRSGPPMTGAINFSSRRRLAGIKGGNRGKMLKNPAIAKTTEFWNSLRRVFASAKHWRCGARRMCGKGQPMHNDGKPATGRRLSAFFRNVRIGGLRRLPKHERIPESQNRVPKHAIDAERERSQHRETSCDGRSR